MQPNAGGADAWTSPDADFGPAGVKTNIKEFLNL